MKPTTLRLPPDLAARIDEIAARLQIPPVAVVRVLLCDALGHDHHEPPIVVEAVRAELGAARGA